MKRTAHTLLASLAAFAVVLAGCSDSTGTPIANVSLALTDDPGDVDSVWVDIGEIYLQGGVSEGRTTLLSAADAGDDLTELTQLAGTTVDLVTDVQIPAGNYGQLRFVIDGAVLQTEDGSVYTFNAEHPYGEPATGSLLCPSCTESGIKVLLPGDVANLEAGAHLLVIDFDVSQSFGRVAGASNTWVMDPVIRGAELTFSGAVSGRVDVLRNQDGDPLVEIDDCPAGTPRDITEFVPEAVAQTLTDDMGDPLTTTTSVAEDSTFVFPPLTPDEYAFGFVERISFNGDTLIFDALTPDTFDVTSGGDFDLLYTITSATCTS